MLFGVCGGLAQYFGVESTMLRILLLIVAVFSAGSVIMVYLIAALVIPREPYTGPSVGYYGSGGYPGSGWGQAGPPPHAGTPHSNGARPEGWNGQGAWNPLSGTGYGAGSGGPGQTPPGAGNPIDAMMEDIEKKALKREIEELKARLAKFENQMKKGE
jgi:phage shock protein PspC (stress-responsive transcriptional regulator)